VPNKAGAAPSVSSLFTDLTLFDGSKQTNCQLGASIVVLNPNPLMLPAPVTLRPLALLQQGQQQVAQPAQGSKTKLIQSQRLVLKGETLTEAGALMSSP
jgi:hypothetical protein